MPRSAVTILLPTLPMPELSQNQAVRLNHWRLGEFKEDQVQDWIICLREAWGPPPYPRLESPVSVTFTLRGTGKRTDVSNWMGHLGLKVLLDCLTEPKGAKDYGLGILVDDSYRYVRRVSVEVEPTGEPSTEIRLEVMEEAQ